MDMYKYIGGVYFDRDSVNFQENRNTRQADTRIRTRQRCIFWFGDVYHSLFAF
jgi:hypothetical protein